MAKSKAPLVRTPAFWIALVALSAASVGVIAQVYPKAFPIVTLDIKMSRTQALARASELALKYGVGPRPYRLAASFDLDEETQNFVELAAGGSDAFAKILSSGIYAPYTWEVRLYNEGEAREARFEFTPDGRPYGFFDKWAETTSGPALPREKAQVLAEAAAQRDWGVKLADYKFIEHSHEARPSGRVDHRFVYERTRETIGEGRYRLSLLVRGDQFSGLSHTVKIPDEFSRRYSEMRSSNETITTVATVAMFILHLGLGCLVGLFFLARSRWALWRQPLWAAGVIAILGFASSLNQLPLAWMGYDTAISEAGFLINRVAQALAGNLADFILVWISLMAAESLSRKAFPNHPLLWKLWSRESGSSIPTLGRTVGAYLLVPAFFAFVVSIYWVGKTHWGWWNRSEALFNPDALASTFPWLSSIAMSLHAGFWEECLFRAVPLAGSALLGDWLEKRYRGNFGSRRHWLPIAFVVQALVFASAHASYMTQPSWARVVELILPSFLFGALYLGFGLLPGIVLHYTFDVTAFAMPLFATQAPRVWIDRGMVIFLTLVPLWVVVWRRFEAGKWLSEYKRTALNAAFVVSKKGDSAPELPHAPKSLKIPGWLEAGFAALSLAGLALYFSLTSLKLDVPPLGITKSQAQEAALKALEAQGFKLALKPQGPWEVLAAVPADLNQEDRFAWRTAGEDRYRELVPAVIRGPSWQVRVARFSGTQDERAEEFHVSVDGSPSTGPRVYSVMHTWPEARPGATLKEAEARTRAEAAILKNYGLKTESLEAVTQRSDKRPGRLDWTFTYKDKTQKLPEGEVRIQVWLSGDEISAHTRFVFVPEKWERAERNRKQLSSVIRMFSKVALFVILLCGGIAAVIRWSRKKLEAPVFLKTFAGLLVLETIELLNTLPTAAYSFSTAQPASHQWFSRVSMALIGSLFGSALLALGVAYIDSLPRKRSSLGARTSTTLAIAVSLGVLLAVKVAQKLGALTSPLWGRYTEAGSALDALNGLATLPAYVRTALVILLVLVLVARLTRHWTRNVVAGAALVVLTTLVASGNLADESIRDWLTTGLGLGLVGGFAYRHLVRSEIALVPTVVGTLAAIIELREAWLQAYPGACVAYALGAIAVFGLGLLASQRLREDRHL